MSKIWKFHRLAPALVLVGALAGCATYGSTAATLRAMPRCAANVQTAINRSRGLGAPDSIQVQTIDRVVYLDGMVSKGLQSREAEAIARQTPGVTRVVNLIAVSK